MKYCSALPNRPALVTNGVGVQGASQPAGGAPPQSGKHEKVGRAPSATALVSVSTVSGMGHTGQAEAICGILSARCHVKVSAKFPVHEFVAVAVVRAKVRSPDGNAHSATITKRATTDLPTPPFHTRPRSGLRSAAGGNPGQSRWTAECSPSILPACHTTILIPTLKQGTRRKCPRSCQELHM